MSVTPRISLVAYDARDPWFIFVAVPNERGRYVRTDKCVALYPCPICGATVGEPCMNSGQPGTQSARYMGGTHHLRRRMDRGSRPDDVIEKPEATPAEHMEAAA